MEIRDTIPRVTHLSQFEAVMDGLDEGLSFDELRKRLKQVAIDLARVSGGREPSGHPDYIMWSPTKDALEDLMRGGWVEKARLPSVRHRVDAYRTVKNELTDEGRNWVRTKNAGKARELLGAMLINQHSYFREYLSRLSAGPLLIPEFTDSDIDQGATVESLDYIKLAQEAINRINNSPAKGPENIDELATQIETFVLRRFARKGPKNKKVLLDAVLDSILASVVRHEGMRADPTSLVILASWSRELFLTGTSRYVQDAPGGWLHWAGADINTRNEKLLYTRRGLGSRGDHVQKMLRSAANDLKRPGTELIEIYPLRGTVAFRCGVANEIVDRVIVDIITKKRVSPYEILPTAGALFDPPASEKPLTFGGRKYYLVAFGNKLDQNKEE